MSVNGEARHGRAAARGGGDCSRRGARRLLEVALGFCKQLRRGLGVEEQLVDLLDVALVDDVAAVGLGEDPARREHLHGEAERGARADLAESTFADFPFLNSYVPGRSVTEAEIMYGALGWGPKSEVLAREARPHRRTRARLPFRTRQA